MAYARSYRSRPYRPRRSSTALRSRPLGTRKGAKKAVRTYKAARFTKAVKSAVSSSMETKRVGAVLAQNATIYGGGLDYNMAALSGWVLPNVLYSLSCFQGINSAERIGDRINPMSLWLRGVVNTNTFDTVNNISFRPFDVHIIVFRYVPSRDLPGAQLNMKYDIDAVTPEAVPIDGTAVNELLPMHCDYRKIAHRVLRLRPPESADQIVAANTIRTNTQTSNAPFYKKFAIKVPMPKVLKYATPTTQFPANFWFGVGAYVIDANGLPTPQSQRRAKLHMTAQMNYKDS